MVLMSKILRIFIFVTGVYSKVFISLNSILTITLDQRGLIL